MAKRKKPIKRSFTDSKQTVNNSETNSKKSFLGWLDEHLFLFIAGFLFAFIPIYPKLPLADIIPGYIVRLRLEDLFVGAAMLIYGIQVVRKKAPWKTPFTWLILGYALVGLLSTASAVLITKTVPAEPLHVGKTLLHYFRYLEYFSLFFIGFSAIRSRKDFKIMMAVFAVTVVLITIYGFGQKYYYWPVYSTMNREFSKGMRLYLTEHARVQSTFGGHYDMAGYLVIALPMLLAAFFSTNQWRWRAFWFISFLAGLWLLIMSASRTSFGGFFIGVTILLLLFALQKKTWREKFSWGLTRGLFIYTIVGYMFVTYGESINERFMQTLQGYPKLYDTFNDLNGTRKDLLRADFNGIIARYSPVELPEAKPPENGMSLAELEQVMVSSDEQPATRPADVYVDVPDIVISATTSADGTIVATKESRPREFSDNALKYGLSMAIRLDTLWPRAIAGFQRNPLFGSGYATLTKANVVEFTEAESTDNNFLRTLGETGLLGFVTFYGTVLIGMVLALRVIIRKNAPFAKAVATGFIAASVGLLFNAVYIDVFASSKIAFTYWALSGFVLAYFVKELHVTNQNS